MIWRARCARLLPYVLLVGAVLAAYSNVYGNAFLYDDVTLIIHNQFLRSWDSARTLFVTSLGAGSNIEYSYYRPLQMLLYLFVFQTAGLSVFAFHLLNVGLHTANACLVYKLGQKLDFKRAAAFGGALLWALHPVQIEAVTYMSATADTLYSFFCLLGVLILLPDFTGRRMLAVVPLMILGFLSKESAVSLPLLAASCVYLVSDKRFELKTYFKLWPLVFVTAAYVVVRFSFLPHGTGQAVVVPYAVNYATLGTLPRYLGLLLFPAHLHFGYELPVYANIWHATVLGGLALVVAALFQIMREKCVCSRPMGWGLFWFAVALLPSFGTDSVFYEHWLYLPSVGLFLGTAQTIALFAEGKIQWQRGCGIGVVLLAVTVGFLTFQQNEIWRDPIVFYTNILAREEKAAKIHVNLGAIYAERGDYKKAVEENQAAIKNSDDTLAVAQTNLAVIELMQTAGKSQTTDALDHLQRALVIDPDFYAAIDALADYYSQQGDIEQAAEYRRKADTIRKKFMTLGE